MAQSGSYNYSVAAKKKVGMVNAGKYRNKIIIQKISSSTKNSNGITTDTWATVLEAGAEIKTVRGYTMFVNNSDFEKAYVGFTIRYPKVEIERGYRILYKTGIYRIDFVSNVDEQDVELEMQAIRVEK